MTLEEYLSSADVNEAVTCLKELNAPSYHPDVVERAVGLGLEKKERDRLAISKLFSALAKDGLFTPDQFEKGYVHTYIHINARPGGGSASLFVHRYNASLPSLPFSFFVPCILSRFLPLYLSISFFYFFCCCTDSVKFSARFPTLRLIFPWLPSL